MAANPNGQTRAGRLTMIQKRDRRLLAAAGLVSWAAGGVATFLSANGSGAVALIAAGVAAGSLAGVGRWPSRVVISGNELYWDEFLQTVDAEIQEAQEDASPELVAELEQLRARLAALKDSGGIPPATADEYDRQLLQAIARVRPDIRLRLEQLRSPFAADYRAETPAGGIWVETKWRRDESSPFRGRTLPSLLGGLTPEDRLLVVVNAVRFDDASALVNARLGDHGRVVGWRNPADDEDLEAALDDLLPRAG